MELPELVVPDVHEWRRWLHEHHRDPAGVWLVLARTGTTTPTSLSYDDALSEAICFGWIDGQLRSRDERTFRRRFTPRRPRSLWSKRNVMIAEGLMAAGPMHPAGHEEVERARSDGRWGAAYDGQATIDEPDDLLAALAAKPEARAMFDRLTRANRYALLYRIHTAKRPETRARRIHELTEMLSRGETLHPQSPTDAE